jgi:hypothetical protein
MVCLASELQTAAVLRLQTNPASPLPAQLSPMAAPKTNDRFQGRMIKRGMTGIGSVAEIADAQNL